MKQFFWCALVGFVMLCVTSSSALFGQAPVPGEVPANNDVTVHAKFKYKTDKDVTFKDAGAAGVTSGDCVGLAEGWTWELSETEGRRDFVILNDGGEAIATFSGCGDKGTSGGIRDKDAGTNGKWGGKWSRS